jgi:hypothetical protein
MQKLTGIISGKNNKSCEIFHHESNKIRFEFFWFFYDFLLNLQESAKTLYYFSYTFAAGALEVLDSYIYTLALWIGPQKNWDLCNVVLGTGRRGSGQIPTKAGGGDGRGAVLGLLGAGFDRSPGRWGSRRSRAAAAAAASCGAPSSGEVEAGDNGWGGSVVSVGARGGEGWFNLACGRLELGAHRGCP